MCVGGGGGGEREREGGGEKESLCVCVFERKKKKKVFHTEIGSELTFANGERERETALDLK